MKEKIKKSLKSDRLSGEIIDGFFWNDEMPSEVSAPASALPL
jgi:hypothetical protein